MIRVHGKNLKRQEKRFLRLATHYTMDYLLNGKYNHLSIQIHINSFDNDAVTDEVAYVECINKSKFRIWISAADINKRARTVLGKFKKILSHLCHELVHVKQYSTSELVQCGTKYRYRGKMYYQPEENDEDGYYESPCEIEAYGREQHLKNRFVKHWKTLK